MSAHISNVNQEVQTPLQGKGGKVHFPLQPEMNRTARTFFPLQK